MSHLVGGVSLHSRRIRDRSLEDRTEEHEERHHRKQLPGNVEALGVLLDDEDHGDDQEQERTDVYDPAERAGRLGSRLHLVPVVGADVGAVALVEACAPGREAGAGAGCADRRVQPGRSDLRRVQSDRRSQRTVNVVAFAVHDGGPFAKRLGLIDASGLPDERENDGEDDF